MEPTMLFPLVTEEGFPEGLCCAECGRVIAVGEPYAERPEAVLEDGTLMVVLTCPACALVDEPD